MLFFFWMGEREVYIFKKFMFLTVKRIFLLDSEILFLDHVNAINEKRKE